MELIRAECPVCGHRYQTYSLLEGGSISCPKCGSLIPVERDWRAPPPSAPPASKSEWSVSGLIKKGFLLLLLGAALFLLLKGEDKALVSFDNGLAVPVHVFIDGKFRRSLSPAEVWNKNLRSDYHSVEIRRIDGKAMGRKTIFCDKGYYIYNIARAVTL